MSTIVTSSAVTTATINTGAIVATDSSLGIAGMADTQGGAVAIVGGVSSTSGNAGGAGSVTGGAPGATGVGGAASVVAAAGGTTSGTGGQANLTAGAGTAGNADGGNAVVTAGAANGTGKPGVIRQVGQVFRKQVAPAVMTTAATMLAADMATGIISATPTATGATVAYTLPTGTLMESIGNLSNDDSFDWSIHNLAAAAADTITITAGSGHTVLGSMLVASNHATTSAYSAAKFRTRKTATNTFVTYRIG